MLFHPDETGNAVRVGKVVKMGQGHEYTHAHSAPLDLIPLARMAEDRGFDPGLCASIAGANTARHALELLKERNAADVIEAAGRLALEQSRRHPEPAKNEIQHLHGRRGRQHRTFSLPLGGHR
jgi:cobalt-precorrin-5B (C1)-methyltransferase